MTETPESEKESGVSTGRQIAEAYRHFPQVNEDIAELDTATRRLILEGGWRVIQNP
jgi:hypothetical protein